MRNYEFLTELKSKLVGLPPDDVDNRLSFYEEMIDDRMDEGLTEEEAVADIGTVDEVIKEIAKDTPLVSLVKHKMKPKRTLKAWEIVLICVSFPFWLPFVIVGLVLLVVAIILMWTGAIVVYATEVSLIASFFVGLINFFASMGAGAMEPMYLGVALVSLGGAVLLSFGCYGVTKGMIKATKGMIIGIKSWFIKKGDKRK